MTDILTGGMTGLLMGIALQRCALTDRHGLMSAMALNNAPLTRRILMMLGWATLLTAFLCWLAVIDVDTLVVLPLHAGTLLGGVIFGAAAGGAGFLPGTVPAVIGGGRLLEGLCAAVGCAAGALLLPLLQPLFQRVQGLFSLSDATIFRVTLDKPFLLPGGFLAQGCLGILLMLAALLIPSRSTRKAESPDPEISVPAEPPSTDAEDIQADTVIALLPGEEPVVVDTALPDTPDEIDEKDSPPLVAEKSEAPEESEVSEEPPEEDTKEPLEEP